MDYPSPKKIYTSSVFNYIQTSHSRLFEGVEHPDVIKHNLTSSCAILFLKP